MRKVAFLSEMDGTPWGGSEPLWSETALRLQKTGDVQTYANVIRWDPSPRQILEMEEKGCVVTRRAAAPPFSHRVLWKLKLLHLIPSWLETVKPDLVVFSLGGAISRVDVMEECISRKIPYVIIVQAAQDTAWPDDSTWRRLKRCYESAETCYFVSQRNADLVRLQFVTPLTNARVVRNPFNVPYDSSPAWPEGDTFRLACVARLEPHAKGQDVLFQVLTRTKWRERPLEVTLLGGGSFSEGMKALRDLLHLDKVHLPGFSNNLLDVWQQHHALVLPSRFEGLPIALVETMLCGRMAITTDVAGNTELVKDGINGFVAGAPTADLLDDAMERAWRRRGEWRQIGEAASRFVRQVIPPDPIEVFKDELLSVLEGRPHVIPLASPLAT